MFYLFMVALLALAYETKKAETLSIPTSIEIKAKLNKEFPVKKIKPIKKKFMSDDRLYSLNKES